jgi:copper chaperone NosL
MKRRTLLQTTAALVALAPVLPARAEGCATDGTPMQFIPKGAPDPNPTADDIAKYPKCPYCGMSRKEYHHSRMLVQFSDDLADGTCSIHCTAISLAVNVDRVPKAIYAADNAATTEPLPLTDAEKATFLVGSDIKGVMTRRSKVAYATAEAAAAAQAKHGGETTDFSKALLAAYTDMSEDVNMIRKKRDERRKAKQGGAS